MKLALFLTIIAVVVPRPASGQLCHVTPVHSVPTAAGGPGHDPAQSAFHTAASDTPALHVEVAVAVAVARLDGADVQGMTAAVHAITGRVALRIAIPTYRLARTDGDTTIGVGDVTAFAGVRVVAGDRWRTGLGLGLGAPTGDEEEGLGMGHVMALPGVWGVAEPGRWRLAASASFAAGIGAGGSAHDHHGASPTVNPMNAREFGGSLRTGYAASDSIEVYGLVVGAIPIGDGVGRAIGGAGARWRHRAWSVGGEADAGIAGNPFIVRGVLDLTRHF